MCELLGMAANVPTDICFSFSGLMQRGGRTGPHRDGWGIAFYDGKGCRTFHDTYSSNNSEVAQLVRNYPIKSEIVISHIRQATHGRVCLENTHPFSRELWGRMWTFAHNGKLNGVKKRSLDFYRPVGTTDSEHAFCWLLGKIRERFATPPRSLKTLRRFVSGLCDTLSAHGTFNMLLSDSKSLYAYCTTDLCYITRRAPFGEASLLDEEMTVDFLKETTPNDIVTVIATKPLTGDESWTPIRHKHLIAFDSGLPSETA